MVLARRAVKKDCLLKNPPPFPTTNPAPSDLPGLVTKLNEHSWRVIGTFDTKNNGFLSYKCTKFGFSGTAGYLSFIAELKLSPKLDQPADTKTVQVSGVGKQDGNSGRLEFNLNSGLCVITPAELELKFYAIGDGWALARGNKRDQYYKNAQQWQSGLLLLSKYTCFQTLLDNSKDSVATRNAIKNAANAEGGNFAQIRYIDAASCPFWICHQPVQIGQTKLRHSMK